MSTTTVGSTTAILHKEVFTQRSLYTGELLRTAAIYTEKSLHRGALETLLHRGALLQSSFVTLQNLNSTSVLDVWPSFCAIGLHRTFENCNFTRAFAVRPPFRAKGLHLCFKIAIFPQFFTLAPHFVGKGNTEPPKSPILPHVRGSDTHDQGCTTHDLRRYSIANRFFAAPAALRANLGELEKQEFCRSSATSRSPRS